jgi:hypothetical protein
MTYYEEDARIGTSDPIVGCSSWRAPSVFVPRTFLPAKLGEKSEGGRYTPYPLILVIRDTLLVVLVS